VAILEALRYLVRTPAGGGDARASACLRALERLERHFGSPLARAALQEGRALMAAADGSLEDAATLFSRAGDAWEDGVFPLREARARAASAQTLRRAGHDADADGQHERARAILASLAVQIPGDELRSAFARAADAMLMARES
ncbi:MAG: hypothetical protein P8Y05_15430, partial [Deinococcales bacterium]